MLEISVLETTILYVLLLVFIIFKVMYSEEFIQHIGNIEQFFYRSGCLHYWQCCTFFCVSKTVRYCVLRCAGHKVSAEVAFFN